MIDDMFPKKVAKKTETQVDFNQTKGPDGVNRDYFYQNEQIKVKTELKGFHKRV
jgi:hypothetical protein